MSAEHSIPLDPQSLAFFRGVTDAEAVNELWSAAGMPAASSDHRAYAIWWFYLGRQSERPLEQVPPLTQATQSAYLAGVACRAPDLQPVEAAWPDAAAEAEHLDRIDCERCGAAPDEECRPECGTWEGGSDAFSMEFGQGDS